MRIELVVPLLIASVGCDDHPCDLRVRSGLTELDEIALSASNPTAGTDRVQADGRLVVEGVVPDCPHSSSCTEFSGTDCTIEEVSSGVLELRYDYEECVSTVPDRACSADCRREDVRCESPALARGEYTLKHRDERYTFTVGDDAKALDTAPFRPY